MIQSVSCGHDDDVQPIRDVRLESTYARGSRACYGACDLMVGMFFSLFYVFIFSRYYFGSAKVVFFNLFTKYFANNYLKMLHYVQNGTHICPVEQDRDVYFSIKMTIFSLK